MYLTKEQSRACYRAAYCACSEPGSFDVVIDPDNPDSRGAGNCGAGVIASGVHLGGDVTVMRNVSPSDFGHWSVDDTSEDEFVDGCMDSFGCIEISDEE